MFRRIIIAVYAVCLLWRVALGDGCFVLPPPSPEDIRKGIKAAYKFMLRDS